MSAKLKNSVARLARKTVLVLGDVILDEYITGRATRMSREAPVPVLELESTRFIAGGAANPAVNIVALGSRAIQAGAIGADENGAQLLSVLNDQGIDCAGMFTCADRPTTVKTRVMAQMGLRFPQQVTRIDTISHDPIDEGTEAKIVEFVSDRIGSLDAVLLSQYHGGLLTPTLLKRIRDLCRQHSILLTADVQGKFARFAGVDVVKCNAADAERHLNRELETDDDFRTAAACLHGEFSVKRATIVTMGNRGAALATDAGTTICPSPQVSDVFDTVGAGDTAIAVITLSLAAGLAAEDAVLLANYASGIVVRHLGNYAPSPDELSGSIDGD
ncbi:MAG: bifunctional ADP-heptose synthase [Chloroflexi bacterium]|nr:bifunctional ADP-heptose synthase [Chloroflexota bacterium]